MVFTDIISMGSHGKEGVWFGNSRVLSLICADDVVLLDFSGYDLQRGLELSVK